MPARICYLHELCINGTIFQIRSIPKCSGHDIVNDPWIAAAVAGQSNESAVTCEVGPLPPVKRVRQFVN